MTGIAEIVVASLPGKAPSIGKRRYCVTKDGRAVKDNQCLDRVWMPISKLWCQ